MYGAIIGDLAGSIYEYSQIKKITPITCDKLIEENSFISDDTILTIAILDAILENKNYEDKIKEYIHLYKDYYPNFSPYFETSFSKNLIKWSMQKQIGNSNGNGAMMRISPVGFMFNREEDVIENARKATVPSHNSKEAIECATTIALIIFYARKGFSKQEIIEKLNLNFKDKKIQKFNTFCYDTIDICLYTVFNTNSYDESIRKILLYGGDTDTNACIVGSMAEALYGINDDLIYEANKKIPKDFQKKLKIAYKKII